MLQNKFLCYLAHPNLRDEKSRRLGVGVLLNRQAILKTLNSCSVWLSRGTDCDSKGESQA